MPDTDFLTTIARILGSKKVPIAGVAILVAGYVATTVAPQGTEKNAAIAASAGVLMLFIYFFFHKLTSFSENQRGPLAIVILLISSVLLIVQARAAIEFVQAVIAAKRSAEALPEPDPLADSEKNGLTADATEHSVPEFTPAIVPRRYTDAGTVENNDQPQPPSTVTSPAVITIFGTKHYRTSLEELEDVSVRKVPGFPGLIDTIEEVDNADYGFAIYYGDYIGRLEFEKKSASHIQTRWGENVLNAVIVFAEYAYAHSYGGAVVPPSITEVANDEACWLIETFGKGEEAVKISAGLICTMSDMLSRPAKEIFENVSLGFMRCSGPSLQSFAENYEEGCSRYCKFNNDYESFEFQGVPPIGGEPCKFRGEFDGVVTYNDASNDASIQAPNPPMFAQ